MASKFGFIERAILQIKRLLEYFKKESVKKDFVINNASSIGFTQSVVSVEVPSANENMMTEPRRKHETARKKMGSRLVEHTHPLITSN